MANEVIIERGGTPGPGADVLEPILEQAIVARDASILAAANSAAAAAASELAVSTIIRANLLELEPGIAAPRVINYTSTAGRFRLGPTGFSKCQAAEERLCYDPQGRFLGTMLQPADTYYSARWDDSAAPHTNTDTAYLTASSGSGTWAYAGAHLQNDIFGTQGKGFVFTQGSSATQYVQALNCRFTPAVGDLIRVSALVSIAPTANPGNLTLRALGNASAFNFAYDVTGAVTGFTETWASIRSGYYDLGMLNGKRWTYIWYDVLATSTNPTYPAIGFGTADTSMSIHVCDLVIQRNPQSCPAAVPVCEPAKTFTADTVHTGITQNVGYIMPYLAAARSQCPMGQITVPVLPQPVGISYLPIEKQIRVVHSTESADRSGIMHNSNAKMAFTPWRTPVNWVVGAGPSNFPDKITAETNKGCTNYTVRPVFVNRPELQPIIKSVETNSLRITGTLTMDDCILFGQTDTTSSYWQQTDIRSGQTASQYLAATSGVYARRCLVLGVPISHTRAWWQEQEDSDSLNCAWVGEFRLFVDSGVINATGCRVECFGRGHFPSGGVAPKSIAFDASDSWFDKIWSDHIYPLQGNFVNPRSDNLFMGRFTCQDQVFWQSQKEIEVDLLDGAGWRNFSTTGLTQDQLPQGRRASHLGSYDFDTGTLTINPNPNLTMMIRRFSFSSGSIADRPGFQFHADQMQTLDKTYRTPATLNSVWVISTATMRVRVYVQGGSYSASSGLWVPNSSGNPAATASGTHADNYQTNTSGITWDGFSCNNVFMLNNGQGPYMSGALTARIGALTFRNFILITSEINGSLLGNVTSTVPNIINLENVLLMQRANTYRFPSGSAEATRFSINGSAALTTANLSNVYTVTSHPTGLAVAGTAIINGGVTRINAPLISNFDEVGATTLPAEVNFVPPEFLDEKYGVVKEDVNPLDFYFTAFAEMRTNIKLNAILTAVKGNHSRWNDFLAELERVYHSKPAAIIRIPNDITGIGTYSLNNNVKASSFHPTHGANRGTGMRLTTDGRLELTQSIQGLNNIFCLRTAFDEVILVDVYPPA